MLSNTRKLPLYLGLSVFIISVLFSAVKIGERNSVTVSNTRAALNGVNLTLTSSSPNMVNVYLKSPEAVSGVDISIKYKDSEVRILPSTLRGGDGFSVSGGEIGSGGNFSFSAITKSRTLTDGIIATFEIQPSDQNINNTKLEFIEGAGNTSVLNTKGNNLNYQTNGLDIRTK